MKNQISNLRADNWNRFGQSQQGEGGRGRGGGGGGGGGWQEGGNRGGNWTPRGNYRGGYGHQSYHTPHGDSVYTPRGRGHYNSSRGGRGDYTPRGGRGEYTPRGGGRGGVGGGYTPTPIGQQGQGYFSPQMLQDPWEELRRDTGGWGGGHKGDNQGKRKSGEMLQEDENSSEDVTKKAAKPLAPFYRTGGDGEQERKAYSKSLSSS